MEPPQIVMVSVTEQNNAAVADRASAPRRSAGEAERSRRDSAPWSPRRKLAVMLAGALAAWAGVLGLGAAAVWAIRLALGN